MRRVSGALSAAISWHLTPLAITRQGPASTSRADTPPAASDTVILPKRSLPLGGANCSYSYATLFPSFLLSSLIFPLLYSANTLCGALPLD